LVTDFLIDLQSLSQLVSAHRRTSINYNNACVVNTVLTMMNSQFKATIITRI